MNKILIAAAGLLALSSQADAQTAPKKTQKPAEKKTAGGAFKKTPNGLEYLIVRDVPGEQTAHVGDYVEMHIFTHIGDSVLFDSRKANENKPVPFQVPAPNFKGDLAEGFPMLSAGDSAIFRVPVDSLLARGNQPLPWMKKGAGQKVEYNIEMVSVKTKEQMQKEQQEHAGKQMGIDDQLLQDYFKKNNITASKTASGMYYKITAPGTGENAKAGQKVTVNYTGKTMDGKTFDSNVDPAFNHVQPFTFGLGQHQVISGWDEGVALLKKGGKATLYIPSAMAYGERSPSPLIPANSVLIFDVEVTDIQ
ncbi:FKBP-type peptidyl-prolyl cis-trans isomerase [Chitinophagaceae bacterium MMS25-I14]